MTLDITLAYCIQNFWVILGPEVFLFNYFPVKFFLKFWKKILVYGWLIGIFVGKQNEELTDEEFNEVRSKLEDARSELENALTEASDQLDDVDIDIQVEVENN